MTTSEFEPGRLRVARELAGLSQAQLAERAAVSPPAISQFESGAIRPSPETVTSLGDALEVPATFFSQPLAETHEGFFRSLRRTTVADRRRARAIAHVARDVALNAAISGNFPASSIPTMPLASIEESRERIEAIAEDVRAEWKVAAGPIQNVVEILESHGIVVIRLPLDSADVDAFSLPFADHPVVVLGSDKNDRARSRFDAAHELGHLIIHGDQIWGMKEVETQAHQFAAAILMPEKEIYRQLPTTVDWPRLFELKRRWQVSLAALLMRSRALGRMSEGTYLTAIKAASARGWRRREPVPLGPPEQPKRLFRYLTSPMGQQPRENLPRNVVDSIEASVS